MTPLKNNVLRLLVSLCALGLVFGLMTGTALAAITSYSAANDATSVSYHLQYTGTYSFYRVYIDTDQNAATGFQTSGLGADYLLENGRLYRYSGTGPNWSWSFIKSVTYSNAAGVADWTVARADIGETATPNAAYLLFQVEAPLESSPRYTHTYSGNGSAITSYSAANDATYVYYELQYTGTYSFYRVYIDTDQNAATGFQTGGLGADYLLENGRLYRYSGTGPNWSWSFIESVTYSNAAGVADWTVARADIGETATPNAAYLLFQVEAPLESSPRYTHTYSGGASSGLQKLAIPSYFYPGSWWTQLQGGAPTVGLAIINPASGPGTSMDTNYYNTTKTTQSQGILVLGYVYTSYATRAAAAVKADIDTYYAWYGVNGIFLDETSTNCAQQSYYLDLYNYVKAKGGTAKVVLNPGTVTPECYITAGDILITFEDTYTNYLNWQPSGWESKYPSERFWHLVHTTTQGDMPNAIALSKSRQVGWIYVTPDALPNPWDTLPTGTYWTDELYRASH